MSAGGGGNWRGWRGSWRGRYTSKHGSYPGSHNSSHTGRDIPPGYSTPTHSYGDLTPNLTPGSIPFIGSIPSLSDVQVMRQRELELCPFEAWDVYLPSVCYESCGKTEQIVTTFLRFFSEFFNKEQFDEIESDRVIHLDFDELVYDPDLLSEIPTIADLIRDDPDQILGAICLAVDQILMNKSVSPAPSSERVDRLSARLYNYSPLTSLRTLRAAQYGKLKKSKNNLNATKNPTSIFDDSDRSDQLSLPERLSYQKEEEFEPIPPALLKKFIAYARSNIFPKISPEAANVLKGFYMELKQYGSQFDCIPITTLHLESLVRLTEARARAELRDIATEEDAYDVIDLMKHSMVNIYSDGMGSIKCTKSQRGPGLSQRNQVRALIAELTRISGIRASLMFSVDELRDVADKIGIPHFKFEDVIFSLNNQCYLIKKGPMLFELQNFSCL